MPVTKSRYFSEGFTTIDNRTLADTSITPAAKGILVYLLSRPKTWKIRSHHLMRTFGIGKDALDTIYKSLENGGYLVRLKYREPDGKFAWDIQVFGTPEECEVWKYRNQEKVDSALAGSTDRRKSDQPQNFLPTTTGFSSAGEPAPLITNKSVTTDLLLKEEQESKNGFALGRAAVVKKVEEVESEKEKTSIPPPERKVFFKVVEPIDTPRTPEKTEKDLLTRTLRRTLGVAGLPKSLEDHLRCLDASQIAETIASMQHFLLTNEGVDQSRKLRYCMGIVKNKHGDDLPILDRTCPEDGWHWLRRHDRMFRVGSKNGSVLEWLTPRLKNIGFRTTWDGRWLYETKGETKEGMQYGFICDRTGHEITLHVYNGRVISCSTISWGNS